jgi:hypothetical protein
MSPTSDTLSRLSAASPARVDPDRGKSAIAQAALERILADRGTNDAAAPAPRRRPSPRGLALVLAALVIGVGGAVAATDPFGWRSNNPDRAQYGVNPVLHVRTPSAQEIRCRPASTTGFRCHPGVSGQTYERFDAIRPPAGSAFGRGHITASITRELAAGKITAAAGAKLRADLSGLPDSFFTELQVASRFGTYGGGSDQARVPPAGVPEYLVCETAGRSLACQNLNGDESAPIGAGVYSANPASDWRPAPPHRRETFLPPGITFTTAEYRFLIDLVKLSTSTSSSSGGHQGHRAPERPRGR